VDEYWSDTSNTPRMVRQCKWCGGTVEVLDWVGVPDLRQVLKQVELFRKTCYVSLDKGGRGEIWSWCGRTWG